MSVFPIVVRLERNEMAIALQRGRRHEESCLNGSCQFADRGVRTPSFGEHLRQAKGRLGGGNSQPLALAQAGFGLAQLPELEQRNAHAESGEGVRRILGGERGNTPRTPPSTHPL
jgi:hypothetical protein